MRPFIRVRFRSVGSHGRAAPPLPPAEDRCQATTKSGARCKLPGDPYCAFHKPAAPTARPA